MVKLTRRMAGLGLGAMLAAPAIVKAQGSKEKATFRLKWLPQAQFAGYYVAKAKGFYDAAGVDLTINPGGPNLSSEALVAAGNDTLGVGSGTDSILVARSKNLPLVALALKFQLSANIWVARKSSGITSPKDFRGKKVGTFFTGAQYSLYSMLAKAGVPQSEVTIVQLGASVAPFVDGELDVITTVSYNTLITLKTRVKEDELVFMTAEQFGLVRQDDPIITSEKVMAEKPQLVQAVLGASLKGWKYALENKKEAIDIVMAASSGGNLVRSHQEAMLNEIERLMLGFNGKTKGLGYMDKPTIARQQDVLIEFKALPAPVDIDKGFVTKFWDAVPDADKKV
ncbi:ABC transporter substrate-binding protein [soil metagenome]